MGRSSFDYSYTCPQIDKAINSCKDTIQDYLKDFAIDLCPHLSNDKVAELSKSWGTTIYDNISDCFESVRESNSDMRNEAEAQITALQNEVSDLKDTVYHLEKQLEN